MLRQSLVFHLMSKVLQCSMVLNVRATGWYKSINNEELDLSDKIWFIKTNNAVSVHHQYGSWVEHVRKQVTEILLLQPISLSCPPKGRLEISF